MILYLLGILIYAVPGLWVNYTLNKHDEVLPNMPFTAKEFGLNLLKEQNLDDVNIEDTKIGDHYDTNSKTVRVKPERLDKKSITSITVMCHEIGHAIQHKENYPPLIRRQAIISKTLWLNKISSLLLYAGIPAILATGAFPLIRICIIIIFASILITMISHLITLEVELDASFKRAMPILEKKIPVEFHSSCKSILRVCAFTYVIGSLTSILNVRNIWFLFRAVIFRRWLHWGVGLKLLYEKTISIRLLFMTDFYENLIFTIIMIVWFIIIIYLTKKRIKVKKKEKTEWSMLDIWAIGFVSCGFMFPILIIVAIAVLFF